MSERFRGVGAYERAVQAHELNDDGLLLDVLCYTPDEFEQQKREPSIVQDSIEQGSFLEIEA